MSAADDQPGEGESVPPASGVRPAQADAHAEGPAVLDSSPGAIGRVVGRPLFWVVLVSLLALVPLAQGFARKLPEPPPKMYTLPQFELTSEKNLPYGSKQLEGRVWVASFVFTSCPSICPALMEKMQEVQHRTRNAGAAVQLVTFTVDPENDTPDKLHAYARRFKASPYRWTFLTGDYKVLEDTIVAGFKLAMGKDADNLFEIFHSERFVLIDQDGRIRGYYDATDEGVEKLSGDITLVLNASLMSSTPASEKRPVDAHSTPLQAPSKGD